MIEGACHCGAVRLRIPHATDTVTECNCSICRRLGAQWSYFEPGEFEVVGHTAAYSWGDLWLTFHHCPSCGCTTHYLRTERAEPGHVAVNARLFDAPEVRRARVRRFDGAESWRYLD